MTKVLVKNFPLVRTFIGEIQRHHGCEQQVLQGIFRFPLRAGLIQRLDDAKARGELPPRIIDTDHSGRFFHRYIFHRRPSPDIPIDQTEYSSRKILPGCG